MSPADILSTVKVDDGHGGFIVINSSDYSEGTHKLFVHKPDEVATAADSDPDSEEAEVLAAKPALRKRGA